MLLFIDAVSSQPYHSGIMDVADVGASSKTAMMIAEWLGRTEEIVFAQRYDIEYKSKYVTYTNINNINALEPRAVIIIRDISLLSQVYAVFPNSNIILILDDFYTPKLFERYPCNVPVKIICQSQWHKNNIKTCVEQHFGLKLDIDFIYNPIQECYVKSIDVDKDKLFFANSPNKGLEYTIQVFKLLKTKIPELKLYIANPHDKPNIDGVVYLDRLPYQELLEHLKSSLCLFHPNISYPEVFGCTAAEANYVGTPALVHDFGAVSEVLDKDQVIDARNVKTIYDKIVRWRANRPLVKMKEDFEINNIGEKWISMLNDLDENKKTMTLEYKDNKMKILFIKKTNLAKAPDELANAINKYTNHYCYVSDMPQKGYNILHYHNVYIPANHKYKIIQYHSEPTRVTRSHHFERTHKGLEFPTKELVISQYQATLPEYKGCHIVQNVIDFMSELYTPRYTNTTPIRIGYSPSTYTRINKYFDKGYDKTKNILDNYVHRIISNMILLKVYR